MTVEIYKDNKKEYRWRITAPNGNIVADSAEGYKNKSDCMEMAQKIFSGDILIRVNIDD